MAIPACGVDHFRVRRWASPHAAFSGPLQAPSIRPIFKHIARLAVEGLTDGFEGGEPDGFRLARLEDGEVGGRDANLLGKLL